MSCAASVNIRSWPVSVLGRKPFGMAVNNHQVAANTAKNTSIVIQLYLIDHFKVTS